MYRGKQSGFVGFVLWKKIVYVMPSVEVLECYYLTLVQKGILIWKESSIVLECYYLTLVQKGTADLESLQKVLECFYLINTSAKALHHTHYYLLDAFFRLEQRSLTLVVRWIMFWSVSIFYDIYNILWYI